jgi:hypothetical protein
MQSQLMMKHVVHSLCVQMYLEVHRHNKKHTRVELELQ